MMDTSQRPLFDLDNDPSFKAAHQAINSSECRNFAVYFNDDEAACTTNLSLNDLKAWEQEHQATLGTRWLHFWIDEQQRPLVEYLANKYEVSHRLISFLCPVSRMTLSNSDDTLQQPQTSGSLATSASHIGDIEKGPTVHIKPEEDAPLDMAQTLQNIGVADVLDRLWHFCSIDWGRRFIYTGINILSSVPGLPQSTSEDRPAGQRLWSSLLFCDDGTVISTSECPRLHNCKQLNTNATKVARRHISNTFRQLSKAETARSRASSDLTNVTIRLDRSTSGPTVAREFKVMETSSLLYYYLFDDWMTTYALIARIEHPYRKELKQIRRAMTEKPRVELLETLHSIGGQLIELRQIYQSYAQIISRLLQRHRMLSKTLSSPILTRSRALPNGEQSFYNQQAMLQSHESDHDPIDIPRETGSYGIPPLLTLLTSTGAHLSVSALMRFERLLDRIHLYALNEIEQCLNEKESLVFMTFNLLTLSESHSIEKLTRTTIVLAKATLLFLPVSLLTAYFSIQVGRIDEIYSLKTYWASFGVLLILSTLCVWLLGIKAGGVKGGPSHKSLHQFLRHSSTSATLKSKML